MTDRLLIGILGNRNAGKSTTWNTLFGSQVRTSTRTDSRVLKLYPNESVNVFLVNGSPQERHLEPEELFTSIKCRIILCSLQYTDNVLKTLYYFRENDFKMYVQWLNPGYSDNGAHFDRLGLGSWLIAHGSTVTMRNSRELQARVDEVREFIGGWARPRGLIIPGS